MATTIDGNGVDKIKDGAVQQGDLASGVVGKGPVFLASSSADQIVTNGVYTKVTLATENFDTNNEFNNGRYTPTTPGYYLFIGQLCGNGATTTTNVTCWIFKNSASLPDAVASLNIGASQIIKCPALVYMNGTTDYVELYGKVEGTGTLSFKASFTSLSGFLVRAV